MFDPNAKVTSHHEVRVTMRGVRLAPDGMPVQVSTRSDFVAPDIAPLTTHQREMMKGQRDWTNTDVKPEVVVINGGIVTGVRRDTENVSLMAEKVIRKARPADKRRVLNVQGPAHRRVF